MKKVIFIVSLLISVKSFSQVDTTVVTNLQLQARVMEYVVTQLIQPDQDSVFSVYLKWRAAFKATKPVGTALVTTDTIPTQLLATLYNYTLANSEGYKMSAIMKTQIAAARAANTFLDRLCSDFEDQYTTRLTALRQSGRRLLLGR